jgi:hypothetical protein
MLSCLNGLPSFHRNIAVIGGTRINSNAIRMASLFGRQIIGSGLNLVTGGRMGAGFEASRGAYEACLKLNIDPNKHIFSLVPKGEKPDFKLGAIIHAGKDRLERRIALIQNTDQAFVIGGGQGTRSEIYIGVIKAIMDGYSITAVSGTGGEADRICSVMPHFKEKILNDPAPSEEKARMLLLHPGHCDIDPVKAHDQWFGTSDVPRQNDRLSNEMYRIRQKYF